MLTSKRLIVVMVLIGFAVMAFYTNTVLGGKGKPSREIYYVESEDTDPSYDALHQEASCLDDDMVIGGGHYAYMNTEHGDAWVMYSRPKADNSGWEVGFKNSSGYWMTLRVYAICNPSKK